MVIGTIAKIAVSVTVGGYLGAKAGDALGKGINKIREHARDKKAQEKTDVSYYLNKTYKIESLV